jgi:serine/threonine-protein kinase
MGGPPSDDSADRRGRAPISGEYRMKVGADIPVPRSGERRTGGSGGSPFGPEFDTRGGNREPPSGERPVRTPGSGSIKTEPAATGDDASRANRRSADAPIVDGDFRLVRRIGIGGDSEVFLAEQLSMDGRKVALKVYRLAASETRRDSPFLRERRLLSMVTSDVFPSVYRSGMADAKRPYLAMEFVHGKSLGHFFERGDEAFSCDVALRVLERLVEGLHELHQAGIVHRDLKPDNVILTPRWQGHFVVKMLDFSHARVPFGREARGVTEDADLSGTQYYMAPEQVAKTGTDERTDVYSLALVLYEMLTSVRGVEPYQVAKGMDFFEYMNKALPVPTRPVGTFRPDLPPDLDAVIAKACARDPRNRHQSVIEFHDAVRSLLTVRTLDQAAVTPETGRVNVFRRLVGKLKG